MVPKPTTSRQNRTKASRTQQDPAASTDLQTNGQVDPAAEGGADGSRVEPQVLEELGEGLGQGRPGTLLSYHHAGPDPGQVQTSGLRIRDSQRPARREGRSSQELYLQSLRLQAQTSGAHLHDAVGAEGVPHFGLADRRQPERRVGLQLGRRDEDGLVARVHAAKSKAPLESSAE